jgi:anaerobic glycerol-3-phosphate dehydrogenase
MRGNEFDVLVVGEGLSGITAAAAACQEGAHVMLASKGAGAFVLGAACVDLDGLDYGAVGLGQPGANEAEKAISFFRKLTAAAGCAYEGGVQERRLVPTIMGTVAQVSLAPRQLWKGDPRGTGKAVVVGIEDVLAFDANFVAERLSVLGRQMGLATSYRVGIIKLPKIQQQHWLTPFEIASEIDRNPAYRQALIAALKPLVQDADLLIIPGALGIGASDDDLRRFDEEIGCPVCELPTLPPSVPGLRLLRRLESYLAEMGTEICTGFSVEKLRIDGDRCTGVILDTPGKPRTIHGGSVILASGKFSRLLEDGTAKEPASAPGLRVNGALQPVNTDGVVQAKHVFACGGVLGNFESRYGNAIAIVSGYQAGMLAYQRGVQYASS